MAESKSEATEKSDLMASLPIATEHERELSQQATHVCEIESDLNIS